MSELTRPFREIAVYLRAVFRHWIAIVVIGVVTAGISFLQDLFGFSVPPIVWKIAAIAGVPVAFFLAWRDEYRKGPTLDVSLDLAGEWKYKCTAIGGDFYEWGGIATTRQEATPYGIQFELSGDRQWEKKADESGAMITSTLPTPYYWKTNWGAITQGRVVRFAYGIKGDGPTIEGYAFGDIKESKGRPEHIVGQFFQLPPHKALHGRLEFDRTLEQRHADPSISVE